MKNLKIVVILFFAGLNCFSQYDKKNFDTFNKQPARNSQINEMPARNSEEQNILNISKLFNKNTTELNLVCLQGLNFGSIIINGAGFVLIGQSGTRAASGTIVLIPSIFHYAIFEATGEPGAKFSIFYNGLPLTLATGLVVPNLIPAIPTQLTLDSMGKCIFYIGGRLNCQPIAPGGIHQNSFDITIQYY